MEQKTNKNLLERSSKNLAARIILILVIIGGLLFGWFSVRWQLGNMLADLTSPTEPNAETIAGIALDFSPDDPLANWLDANSKKGEYSPEQLNQSVERFQKLVKLAPNKFSWWLELGRAYEQSDHPENAEKAFLRAVELAPNYTYPHWQLGNFYLRQGRDQEAFDELQKAAETNAVYREQVFSIAWDYYEQNTEKLEKIAGDSPGVRAGLAKFYAVKDRPTDSLRMWNSLTPEEKQANREISKIIAQGLYEKRFYREAVDFVRDLGIEPKARAETIQNGGFEDPIGETDYTYFNWRVPPVKKMDVKLDPTQKKEGNRSLRVTFNGMNEGLFYNIFQIVTVTAGEKYQLSFWVRTENLKSGGMPNLEIVNANDDKIITTSDSFPGGTNDWKQVKVVFTAPENSEAVTLRTSRTYCGENCPIVGAFWYDDFRLEKVS
ncbi:MAG: tetratricopeptide repeat protein [Pyrinomonadaceae bacterium]